MHRDGSLISGALKDALMSICVSLTCGRRCSTLPTYHVELVRACALAGGANNSAGMPRPKAAAEDDRKKSRLFMIRPLLPQLCCGRLLSSMAASAAIA